MSDKVAIYCRLSEEDRDKKIKEDDSGSIQNQKLMLIEYANKQGWTIFDIYSDDDYAGSDRKRPDFNRMLVDAEAGRFDIVLCKTQSRFTRELEIVEKYIHNLFPQWGIRFVSIVDNIDTNIKGNKKARQINGLINEWYLEDMSDSIKAALRTRIKAGYFIGSIAPYGYMKDPEQKGHLIIDEEAASVVREIFYLYTNGMGRTQIARNLNSRGVLNPSEYQRQKGLRKKCNGKSLNTLWKYYSVSTILQNEVYIGNLVQGRTFNPTYKSAHTIPAPKERWVKVENTHDPIIDKDTWFLTRRIWNEKSKPCYCNKTINIFSGKIVCKYCGYNATAAYSSHKRYYRCSTRKFDKKSCQGVTVFEKTIEKAVINELKKIFQEFADNEQIETGVSLKNEVTTKIEYLQKDLQNIKKKVLETDNALKNLYIDKLKNIISQTQFETISEQLDKDKTDLIKQQTTISADIDYFNSVKNTQKSKKEILDKYLNFEKLTRQMVEQLIDKIVIGGTKTDREIVIHWNF